MDLRIAGRKAIVCAASRGLGRAVADSLAAEGVSLVMNGRDPDSLSSAAKAIRDKFGVAVYEVAGDITSSDCREAIVAVAADADILVTNAGGPPPGDFQDATPAQWTTAFEANMLTPILLIQALIDGMISRNFGRIINITTAGVHSPGSYPQMGMSIGVRAGLTGAVATLSRRVAKHNVTINNILPGRFQTQRLQKNLAYAAERHGVPVSVETETAKNSIPSGRFGQPEEFGAFCAFLCSEHAGYVTGKSILLDGGAFPGLL